MTLDPSTQNGKDAPAPGVIESAFGLLEILRALGRARLTDLTEESGLPRTTVSRLLGQLAAVDAVDRVGAHYRLGPGLLALGQNVTPMQLLRPIAQRPMLQLAATTPAHVGLIANTSCTPTVLDILHGRDRLPFRREPGEPVPKRSAAARALRADNGFAIDDNGAIDGVSCAAQTIRLPGGEMAAVGVVVPASRLPRELLGPLRVTAERIATLVALHGPPVTRDT
jgi:IclR family transcriptional regulator, acetate operon repressor